jgi:hypothetical protein
MYRKSADAAPNLGQAVTRIGPTDRWGRTYQHVNRGVLIAG